MTTTTVYENRFTSGFNWSDGDLAMLERLNEAIGAEILRPTTRAGKRELQARQYVGVVQIGPRTVQILPKIHQNTADAKSAELQATGNLLYLLRYAENLPVRETQVASLLQFHGNWLEILTRLFATHLMDEWRRGPIRGYMPHEDNLPVLRGKLRLADQMRRPHRQHLLYVRYDEFSTDNTLNRILRFVVERLWSLTNDSRNRQSLDLLRNWMEEVTLLPRVTVEDAWRQVPSRLNRRFTAILSLARVFLESSALQLKSGSAPAYAFVFDMNKLFEAFLANFILRHRGDVLPDALEGCDILPQTGGATRHLARRDGTPVFRLKPDISFRDRTTQQFPLLIDAKYKVLNRAEQSLGVSEADFYQMYTYHRRYHCPCVLLLHPEAQELSGSPLRQVFTVEGDGCTVMVATLNIHRDLSRPSGRGMLLAELSDLLRSALGNSRN